MNCLKRRHKHQFEPRYDSCPTGKVVETSRGYDKVLVNCTYVRDICVKCGHIVERSGTKT